MRTMYDSVAPAAIPTNAELVAGYLDGPYAWTPADWALFPFSIHVPIVVDPAHDEGLVLDVETGDARPDQAPSWTAGRRRAGVAPSVYCSLDTWPAVQAAFAAANVQPSYYWIGHWDGTTLIPAGAMAKQFADPATSGGHFDLSAVVDHWPGVDPGPAGAPTPVPVTGPTVYMVVAGDTLSGIAARFGLSWQDIYAANREVIGGDPNKIYPGQHLVLHGGTATTPAIEVTVRPGDTLSGLAARYGTTWQAIYAANRGVIGPNPNLIYPDQHLTIPR